MSDTDADHVLGSPDHFIQQLDLGMEAGPDHRLVVTAETSYPCDVGLLATIVDVAGGTLIIGERPGVAVPTTNIELLGVDQLRDAGTIRAEARIAAMSKRRATIEVTFDIAGNTAWGVVGFMVRDDPTQTRFAARGPRPARSGRVLVEPLRSMIGARSIDQGASVPIEPRLYNNATALQGGATVALLEAAALTVTGPGETLAAASINYFSQVRGAEARAKVRSRRGRLVTVDVSSNEVAATCATATFMLT